MGQPLFGIWAYFLVGYFAPNCWSLARVAAAWPESMASAPMATPCFRSPARPAATRTAAALSRTTVATRAGNAGEHVVEQRLVGGDVAAGELIDCGAGQAGHLRRDARGLQLRLAGFGFLDARNDRFARGGQLVDSIGSVHDEGAFGSERRQRAAHEQHAAGREHADHLGARVGGIGERADEIEDGAEAERAAKRPQGLHGRVIERREEEDEAGLAQAFDGQFGRELDGHAESLEHVGSAAARGDCAVAVLGDVGSGGCGHQRGAAGDVEGLRTAAAGADAVDQLRCFRFGEGQRT